MSPHAQQDHQRSNPTHYIYTFKATDKNAQSNAIPAYRPDTRIKADSAKSTGSRTPHEVVHEEPRHIKVVPRPIAVPVRKSILRLVPGEERGDIEEVERAISIEIGGADPAPRANIEHSQPVELRKEGVPLIEHKGPTTKVLSDLHRITRIRHTNNREQRRFSNVQQVLEQLNLLDARRQPMLELALYEPVAENPIFSFDLDGPVGRGISVAGVDNNGNRIRAQVTR